MSTEDISAIYDYITEYIKSPIFRIEIKDFVDDNCGTFFGEDENSFQQYALHKEFKLLIENLLEKMLTEIGATQELFLLVAKKGLENPEDKKYYEQLITCDNYVYFKNMMIKRNLQLEEQSLQLMQEQSLLKGKNANQEFKDQSDWKEFQRLREETELECAIQMSLAIEEERNKLMQMEEEELMKAIELSKLTLNSGSIEEDSEKEISLHDPTTLINKNENLVKKIDKQIKKNIESNVHSNVNKIQTNSTSNSISASNLQNIKPDVKITSKKENNLDLAFYGISNQVSNLSNDDKKSKNYVDVVIEKTEKIKFSQQDSEKIVGITPKNSFADDNDNFNIPLDKININFNPEISAQVPRNLNQIKPKTYQGDRNFLLQNQKIDTTDIKSKIEELNQNKKEIINNIESNKDEITKQYEELQREKNEKLKEYREMLLKRKKEKGNIEKEKDDPFDIDESKLSDEVRKRLQMRKQLADSLKK